MKRDFFDRKEIVALLWEVFHDEVAEVIASASINDTHPSFTVAAIDAVHRFIGHVAERMEENAESD